MIPRGRTATGLGILSGTLQQGGVPDVFQTRGNALDNTLGFALRKH
jgi:hypothetical protein